MLGTGWENKINSYPGKLCNFIQLLNSVFTKICCRFSVDFIEKTTFEEFEEICEQIYKK